MTDQPQSPGALPISVCMHAMNRAWQVKQTLPRNIEACRGRAELVLVNFGSTDDLDDWVRERHAADIERGDLVYFFTRDPERFHASKSKNLAHRLGTGDILFNCDGDNFVTPGDLAAILAAFGRQPAAIVRQFSGSQVDGTYGRIALRRSDFWLMGGYDEGLLPMSGQDDDIVMRALMLGLAWEEIGAPEHVPVENSKKDKVPAGCAGQWRDMRNANLAYIEARQKIMGYRREQQFTSYRGRLNLSREAVIEPGFGAPDLPDRPWPESARHPAERPLDFNKALSSLRAPGGPENLREALALLARAWGKPRGAQSVVLEPVFRRAMAARHGVLAMAPGVTAVAAACATPTPLVMLEQDTGWHRDMKYIWDRYRFPSVTQCLVETIEGSGTSRPGARMLDGRQFDLALCIADQGFGPEQMQALPRWMVPGGVVLVDGLAEGQCRDLRASWQSRLARPAGTAVGADGRIRAWFEFT